MSALISMPVGHPCGGYIGLFIAMSHSIGVDDAAAQVLLDGRASPEQADHAKALMMLAAQRLTLAPIAGHA